MNKSLIMFTTERQGLITSLKGSFTFYTHPPE